MQTPPDSSWNHDANREQEEWDETLSSLTSSQREQFVDLVKELAGSPSVQPRTPVTDVPVEPKPRRK